MPLPLKYTPRYQPADGASDEPHLPDPRYTKGHFLACVKQGQVVDLTWLVRCLSRPHDDAGCHDSTEALRRDGC